MESRFESSYRPQIQRQKIKEKRPVRFRCQRNHLALLILPGVVVNILQVRGFSAQTWTVVHQLAIDFARRKINEGHLLLTRLGQNFIAYAGIANHFRATDRFLSVTRYLVSARNLFRDTLIFTAAPV